MTKSILFNVPSTQLINILNGTQTMLLTKKLPKDFVGWVYLACGKGKPYLQSFDDEIINIYPKTPKFIVDNDWHGTTDTLNGKTVARFWLNNTSLTRISYDFKNEKWTIKIGLLEIFDTPKEVGEFSINEIPQNAIIEQEKEYEKYGFWHNKETPSWHFCYYKLLKLPSTWRYVWGRE
jgi:hypothetical protein